MTPNNGAPEQLGPQQQVSSVPAAAPVPPQAAVLPTVIANAVAPEVAASDGTARLPYVQPGQPPLHTPTTPDNPDLSYDAGAQPLPDDLQWTAAEYVEHRKNVSWYTLLIVISVLAAVIDFILTRDYISTGVILLAAALFGVYAGHKPRNQQYYLNPQGLQIGEKLYPFQSFSNFSVTEEANLASIVFMPLKRFLPPLTIYVGPELEAQVLDYLSEFLPLEQHRGDAVDGLLRRIRF